MPKDPQPRVPAWLVDVLLLALMAPLTLVREPGEGIIWPDAVTVVLVVLAAVALLFRRRWPLPVLCTELVLYGVAAVIGTLAPAISFAIAVAMGASGPEIRPTLRPLRSRSRSRGGTLDRPHLRRQGPATPAPPT